ncbi:glycosyltransferase family 4 protein [Qipengyuania sp. CAU 1752]
MSTRILHLHSTFAAGGKELRCVQLINAFGPAVDHTIVSGEPEAIGASHHVSSTASVSYPRDFPALRGRPWPGRLMTMAKAMQGYDLILSYNWGAMDAVMAHTLFSGVLKLPPLIHHEDGFNEDEQHRLRLSRNIYRRLALARARRLVVPSQTLEKIALQAWAQPRSRVVTIANGIDTAAFGQAPQHDALGGILKQTGELWVGTLAGLRPVKNLPRLVRAFAALPEPWKLVIVGEGPEERTIRAEIDRLGLADRVMLPGFAASPARYVGLFDIFALSSNSEQFPISVVEAMAAGLPVVAPAVGDISEMVAAENARHIVAPGDEKALGDALTDLASNGARRAAIGAANLARARAEYDQESMIATYRQLYGDAVGQELPD